jgi:hypothetical protein
LFSAGAGDTGATAPFINPTIKYCAVPSGDITAVVQLPGGWCGTIFNLCFNNIKDGNPNMVIKSKY